MNIVSTEFVLSANLFDVFLFREVILMMHVPLLQKLKAGVVLVTHGHLKLKPISCHVVRHLIYDRLDIRGRRTRNWLTAAIIYNISLCYLNLLVSA